MGKHQKILFAILRGNSDNNIKFSDLVLLLKQFGFSERIKGSHHIFYKDGVDEIINLQPQQSKSKAYQVKQVRKIILKNKLEI